MKSLSWLRLIAVATFALALTPPSCFGAEVVRSYRLGEDDGGATIGEEVEFTLDAVEFPDDGGGELVDLEGIGEYVAGRNDESPFAISFNGFTDFFLGAPFDPRNFGGSFTTLSQGWVRPSSDGLGEIQTVWAVGNDNGGVGITEDGFWQLNSGGNAGSAVSEAPVAFDEWVHLAVLRGGNGGTLYLNGSVAVVNDGFWNAPGDFYLGSGVGEENYFNGAIDDFVISGFGDGTFDPIADIFFLDPTDVSGVFGDVDQDGIVDQIDYDQWSANVGFDNGQGVGDFTTLVRGDVDQNGRINFFDFEIIRNEAMAVGNVIAIPEPNAQLLMVLALVSGLAIRRTRSGAN